MGSTMEAVGAREYKRPTVHCWDTLARKIVCGEPGQTGSTKHERDVTCGACLVLLGREPHTPFPTTQQ